MKPHVENAPGITWRKKAGGWQALWRARTDLIEKGFTPKSVPLWNGEAPSDIDAEYIRNQCQRLQGEMLAFGRGGLPKAPTFDGTLRTLIWCYQTDPDSAYHKKRWAVRRDHDNFLKRVAKTHGDTRLSDIKARLVLSWHKQWSHDGQKIAIAHSFVAHLRTLFGFGMTMLEDPECERLVGMMHIMKFPMVKSRTVHLAIEHVIAISTVAREQFRHSIALAQVLQFELTLRQKDAIGEYVPLGEPGISDVINPKFNKKWIMGLRWEEIDQNLILRHKTSKRGKDIEVDLKLAPLVLDELHPQWDEFLVVTDPATKSVTVHRDKLPTFGPIIVSESTGFPYSTDDFRRKWREIANAAGVPKTIRNMDTRSGAISEAVISGAPHSLIRHAAVHSDIAMTQKYDREQATATATVMKMRVGNRNKPKN